jgi:hypothetical protein
VTEPEAGAVTVDQLSVTLAAPALVLVIVGAASVVTVALELPVP